MKKQFKTAALFIVLLFVSGGIKSQTLANTKWKVYNSGNFFYYFKFGADTISYSSNNIAYTNISTYTQSANSFTVVDLGSSASCPPGTPGIYTFAIQNDTLKFTLVNDPCVMRSPSFISYDWLDIYTSVKESSREHNAVNIFPNPSKGFFIIDAEGEKEIVITNYLGIVVKKLKTTEKRISTIHLPAGSYLVSIVMNEKVISQKQIIHIPD